MCDVTITVVGLKKCYFQISQSYYTFAFSLVFFQFRFLFIEASSMWILQHTSPRQAISSSNSVKRGVFLRSRGPELIRYLFSSKRYCLHVFFPLGRDGDQLSSDNIWGTECGSAKLDRRRMVDPNSFISLKS